MLRRWRSVSSSWLDRLRISDRKFVNHTTEMILWSMILTSRGFLKSFIRSYGSNIIEAGTNKYWHKCNDVISHSLLTGNAQKYCCLKKYISIYICNYLCRVRCKSYSFGYCHTCCDIYNWCVHLDARGRFQCSSQEQHQMALQLSGLWKPSQRARDQGTESRKRSSSRQTKSPNGLCSFVQEVVSAAKPRIARPLAEQSKWLHAFRHALHSAQKTIRHRFSAFWLRSKCSICSYQLNIWYEGHVPSSILNLFLNGDGE